jgi:hypothetical protein
MKAGKLVCRIGCLPPLLVALWLAIPAAASPDSASAAPEPARLTARQRAHTCAQLDAELQRLESRMRTGYDARASERLWEQRRRLQARRWALRC